ncbi:hypothetical protein [Streptomyces sp. 2A115]|uniref:hypothetical protein n=1 Tax=Streptomyces sp. 2A115 TaxID=3457439 RepID=UPI003FD46FFE
MAERMRFVLDGDDRLTPVFNGAGDSSARLHRRLNDDMNANSRAVTQFTRDANGRLRDLNGRFLSVADASRTMGSGMPDLTRRLGDVSAAGSDAAASLGKSGGGLGGAMGGVAAAAGLSLLPALGALVPMMAGAGLAAGTLKLGFAGVGDAMAAAGKDKEEYEKALKKLSPEARSFTKELVGMKKEFAGVGKDIQKAMLPGFTKAVKDAAPLVKILGKGMTELGGAFGKAAEGAGRMFKDSGFQKDLQTNLDLGRLFVGDMMSGLGGLGRSFLSFGAESKPTLTALSGGIRDVLGKGLPGMFEGLKTGIEGSGKFLTGFFNMINSLLPAIGRFSGEVARALGPVLGELFTSMGVTGAGVLDTLGRAVKGLSPIFKDLGYGVKSVTQLMQIIGPTVKDTAGAIVGALLPSFSEIDKARGPLQRLSASIQNNKGAIQEFARQGAEGFLTLVQAGVTHLPTLIKVFRLVTGSMVTALGGVLHAAAVAFGWIPGIGGKLKSADKKFQSFKDSYISGLQAAEEKASQFAASTVPKLAAGKLKLNINNWESQITTAKAKLKTVPPEKRAALKAKIDDLREKVRQAKDELASLRNRTVTITTVRRTIAQNNTSGRPGQGEGGVSKYAAGGTPKAGELAMVGEQGPELVVFGQAARVFDAGKTKSMLSGTVGAGWDTARGLAGGMGAGISMVEAAARRMAAAVPAGIRGELEIASPSKKTAALAKDVGAGLIKGLTGSREKIKATAKDLAKDIQTAFSGKKEASLLKMLKEVSYKNDRQAVTRDWIAGKIKAAKEFAETTRVGAKQSASLGSMFGGEEEVSAAGIQAKLAQKLTKMRTFTSYIKTLASRGLNKTMLREILEMGPEQGYAYASALAGANNAVFKSINSTQYAINDSAESLGRIGADRLYDAGKNAGKGFLKGLEGQQKAVEDLMMRIAQAMQKSIKKSLGIKSPSTVMAQLGKYSTQGLARGLVDGMPVLDSALAAVSGRVAATSPVLGRPAVAGSGGTTVINLNLEVRPGADPQAVWREVQRGLLSLKQAKGGAALGLA